MLQSKLKTTQNSTISIQTNPQFHHQPMHNRTANMCSPTGAQKSDLFSAASCSKSPPWPPREDRKQRARRDGDGKLKNKREILSCAAVACAGAVRTRASSVTRVSRAGMRRHGRETCAPSGNGVVKRRKYPSVFLVFNNDLIVVLFSFLPDSKLPIWHLNTFLFIFTNGQLSERSGFYKSQTQPVKKYPTQT